MSEVVIMILKASISLIVLSSFTLATAATAQTYVVRRVDGGPTKGFTDLHISKAAMPGEKIRLWFATLTNPDCSPAGTMTTQVVDAPHHGVVDISYDKVYPNFVAPNPRVICDTQKVDGVQAFYTPAADFHGHDKVVLQNATSEGRVRRVVVDVDVR
jgi:hypothetical protein